MPTTTLETFSTSLQCSPSLVWYSIIGIGSLGLIVGAVAVVIYMMTKDNDGSERTGTTGAFGFILAALAGALFVVLLALNPSVLETCVDGDGVVNPGEQSDIVGVGPIPDGGTSDNGSPGDISEGLVDFLKKQAAGLTSSDKPQGDEVPFEPPTPVVPDDLPLDLVPPEITMLGENPTIVIVGDEYMDAGAKAFDDVDGDLTAQIKTLGLPIPTHVPTMVRVQYMVTDSAGNVAMVGRSVRVIFEPEAEPEPEPEIPKDTIDPEITLLGDSSIRILQYEEYVDAGVLAIDNIEGDISASVLISGLPIDTSLPKKNYIYYTASDSDGNSMRIKRIVEVVERIEPDMSTDEAFIMSCRGYELVPGCEGADVNGDGAVTNTDITEASSLALRLDRNKNGIIEIEQASVPRACHMKTLSGSTFECAVNSLPTLEFSESYFQGSLRYTLKASLYTAWDFAIQLSTLNSLLSGSDADRVFYATVAQYDFNGDGIVDLSASTDTHSNTDTWIMNGCKEDVYPGSCAQMDIDRGGLVTSHDSSFLMDWYGSHDESGPYSVRWYEDRYFDRGAYPDRAMVVRCAELGSMDGTCQYMDISKDNKVDSLDVEEYDEIFKKIDTTDDGVISGYDSYLSY